MAKITLTEITQMITKLMDRNGIITPGLDLHHSVTRAAHKAGFIVRASALSDSLPYGSDCWLPGAFYPGELTANAWKNLTDTFSRFQPSLLAGLVASHG